MPNFSLMLNFSLSQDENINENIDENIDSVRMNVSNDKEGLTNKRKFAVVRTKGLDDLVENAQSKKTQKSNTIGGIRFHRLVSII